jgi:hypothetical protein
LSADLTILTVVIRKHYGYVARQLELADRLNPGAAYKMIVVDNTGAGRPELEVDDPRCRVLPGAPRDESLSTDYMGSYHHAAGLNSALGEVDTRFLLVLDPDLFPVYRNWIAECIEHMQHRGLSVFGVPWYYRWYRKYRYYPCVHFMLIDLHKIDLRSLDFTPALAQDHKREDSAAYELIKRIAPVTYTRMLIGTRHDTGWRIHQTYARRSGHGHGLARPVIDVASEIIKPKQLATAAGQRRERKQPRRWSFLPAPGEYLEPGDAPGFGHWAFEQLEPERFVWRGAPFAFHLRSNVRDLVNAEHGRDIEAEALDDLFGRIGRSPAWTDWDRPGAAS